MVVLGNNIENIVFPAKQSPFDSKKDLVAGCLSFDVVFSFTIDFVLMNICSKCIF